MTLVRLVPRHPDQDRDPERDRLGPGERPAAADDGELAVGHLGEVGEEHGHAHLASLAQPAIRRDAGSAGCLRGDAARGPPRRRARPSPRRAARAAPRPAPASLRSAFATGARRRAPGRPSTPSTFFSSRCAQTAPNAPVLAPITATRLAADRRLGDRARDPVERVLQRTRDRAVVLGGRDEDRVRLGDRGLQRVDRVRVRDPRGPGRTPGSRRARRRRRARRPAAAPPRRGGGAARCASRRGGCRRCRGSSPTTRFPAGRRRASR